MGITTIATFSATGNRVNDPPEPKVGFAQGLYWAFFMDGSSFLAYATSADNVTWSGITEVFDMTTAGVFGASGDQISVAISGTSIHWAVGGNSNYFFWRYGTLNADGTISWANSVTHVTTGHTNGATYPCITPDFSGDVWASVSEIDASANHYVNAYLYSNGSWSNSYSGPSVGAIPLTRIVPLQGGNMALVYVQAAAAPSAHILGFDGSTWSTPVAGGTSAYNNSGWSTAAVGSRLHFVGEPNDALSVRYWYSDFPFSSTSAETALVSAGNNGITVLQTDGSTLVLVYSATVLLITSLLYKTSIDNGVTWSAPNLLTNAESNLGYAYVSSGYYLNGRAFFFEFNETVSPYPLKFGLFVLPIVPLSIGQIEQGADVFIRETRYL